VAAQGAHPGGDRDLWQLYALPAQQTADGSTFSATLEALAGRPCSAETCRLKVWNSVVLLLKAIASVDRWPCASTALAHDVAAYGTTSLKR